MTHLIYIKQLQFNRNNITCTATDNHSQVENARNWPAGRVIVSRVARPQPSCCEANSLTELAMASGWSP